MKKLTTKENLEMFAEFVHKQFERYNQSLKWYKEDIRELQKDVKVLNGLIITLFLQIIALITLLIIWSW